MVRLNLQLFAVNASIVDYLKSQGQDSSYTARKQLAQSMGISNYTGAAEQNTQLLKQLKGGSSSAKASTNTATSTAPSNASAIAPASTKISNGNIKLNGVDQGLIDTMNSTFATSSKYQEADAYLKTLREQLNSGKTSYTGQLDNLIAQIQNRDKFEYDVESDMLFQQYLSSMMGSGKTAMQDTIGQASALTGGYGSTYATSAGNQAYNQYIQDAYANLPEYYGLALEAYQMEGEEMYKQLAMLGDADAREYERLYTAYDVNNDYVNTLYGQEYQKWADEVTNATNLAGLQNSDYWTNKNFVESQRQFDAQMKQDKEQFDATMKYNKEKDSSGNLGSVDLKVPTHAQKQKALEAYNEGGEDAYYEYLDSLPSNVDVEEIDLYVIGNGKNKDEDGYVKGYGELPISQRTWTVIDDGGVNWLWGVDNNAKVKDQYGNEYTLGALKKIDKGLAEKLSGVKKGKSYTAK